MARQGSLKQSLRVLLLLIIPLLLVCSAAEAAYRLTFQNGTSVEVQAYEDLGDAIRYPRLGGVVVVPKSSVSTIEEAVHFPPPTVLPSAPAVSRPGAPEERSGDRPSGAAPAVPSFTMPPLQIPSLQWQRVGNTAIDPLSIRILTGVALVAALAGIVAFFMSNTWTRSPAWGERGADARWAARRKGGRPLGIVLVGIYDGFFGLLMLSAGLVGAMTGQVIAELPVFLIPPDSPIVLILVSLAALVLGAFVLATAYGMWSLQTWGWRLQIVVCFTDILLNAHFLLVNPSSAGSLFAVAALFIDSGILVYVSRSELRDWYADQGWDSEEWGEPPTDHGPHTPSP